MITPQTQGTIIHTNGDIFLIKTENDYVLEAWGASTKHPDTINSFNAWKDKVDFFQAEVQLFQWVLYIASMCIFPFNAKAKAAFAMEIYEMFN